MSSLKDYFLELDSIPEITNEQKKTLLSLFVDPNIRNKIFNIVMSDWKINDFFMENIWLWEEKLSEIDSFFNQNNFIDIKTFFKDLKSILEKNYELFNFYIYEFDNNRNILKDITTRKEIKSDTYNLDVNQSKFIVDIKNWIFNFWYITIQNETWIYFINCELKPQFINNWDENIKNEVLQIKKLFNKYWIKTKINQVCSFIQAKYLDSLTQTLKVDYLSQISKDSKYSVIYLDIDDFKNINDTYLHSQWDIYLQEFSKILKDSVRVDDKVIRYWWDEFVILVDTQDLAVLESIINRIKINIITWRTYLKHPQTNTDILVKFSWSIWYSIYEKWSNINELVDQADNEMYRVKKKSKQEKKIENNQTALRH